MGYVEAFALVESYVPEAIIVATPAQINQNGIYLLFDGARPMSVVQDKVHFTIVVAANSYKKENGVMSIVDDLHIRSFAHSKIEWQEVKALAFENTQLYFVACNIRVEIDFRGEL
jgi:hypothetical protein